MLTKRIIPCLDIKDGRTVKGTNFVDLRDAGDPVELAAVYDAEGADELCFLDVTASSSGRATMLDVVRRTGSIQATRDAAREQVAHAQRSLSALHPSIHRDALIELCTSSVERSSSWCPRCLRPRAGTLSPPPSARPASGR